MDRKRRPTNADTDAYSNNKSYPQCYPDSYPCRDAAAYADASGTSHTAKTSGNRAAPGTLGCSRLGRRDFSEGGDPCYRRGYAWRSVHTSLVTGLLPFYYSV
jgi:hypothetical protein